MSIIQENRQAIIQFCNEENIEIAGMLPYDETATKAMLAEKTVVEFSDGPLSQEIRTIWEKVENALR